MKRAILIVTTFIFFVLNSFGQTKYFQTNEGIIDTLAYAKLKLKRLEKLKSAFPSEEVTIKDSLIEIRRTRDSVVYTYRWDIKIGDPNFLGVDGKSFEPEVYIGKEFPFQSLKTIDNRNISHSDLKGKPTLINFWFIACKPCVEEIPVLNNIQNHLKDSVNFIAITFDPADKVKNFLKMHQFTFIQITNAGEFIKSLNMNTFPINIFLDKDGIVRKIENGISNERNERGELKIGDGKEFEMKLRELL